MYKIISKPKWQKYRPKFSTATKTAPGAVVCAFDLEGVKTLNSVMYKRSGERSDEVMDTFLDIYNYYKNKTGNPMYPEDRWENTMFEFSSKTLSFSFKSRYISGDIDMTEIKKIVVLQLSTSDWAEFKDQLLGLDIESPAPCFDRILLLLKSKSGEKIKCKFIKELLS